MRVSSRSGTTPPLEHRIKPGEVRNPRGRPPGTSPTEALVMLSRKSRKKLAQIVQDENHEHSIEAVAAATLLSAIGGADAARRDVFDRIDGPLTSVVKLEVSRVEQRARKFAQAEGLDAEEVLETARQLQLGALAVSESDDADES